MRKLGKFLLHFFLIYLLVGILAAGLHLALGYLVFVRNVNGMNMLQFLSSSTGWLSIAYMIVLWIVIAISDISVGNGLFLELPLLLIAVLLWIIAAFRTFRREE